jgi:hypothetical protein
MGEIKVTKTLLHTFLTYAILFVVLLKQSSKSSADVQPMPNDLVHSIISGSAYFFSLCINNDLYNADRPHPLK